MAVRILYLFLLTCLVASSCSSDSDTATAIATPGPALRIEASHQAQASAIAVDRLGNIYVAGIFGSSLALGSTTVTVNGSEADSFIAKFNPAFQPIWVTSLSGPATEVVTSMTVDRAGNLIAVGTFDDVINVGQKKLVASGAQNTFIASFTPAGTINWATQFKGFCSSAFVAADNSDNISVTGGFVGSLQCGDRQLNSGSFSQTFVATLNGDGDVLWATKIGAAFSSSGLGLGVDGLGNIYVVGKFQGLIYWGTNAYVTNRPVQAFLAKFDNGGSIRWLVPFGGSEYNIPCALAVTAGGDCYVASGFSQAITLGSTTLTTLGHTDLSVAKFDASGTVRWAVSGGGIGEDFPEAIAVDKSGNCYVLGTSTASASFGRETIPDGNGYQVFIAGYGFSGLSKGVANVYATDGSYPAGIAVGLDGRVLITGTIFGHCSLVADRTSNEPGTPDALLWSPVLK